MRSRPMMESHRRMKSEGAVLVDPVEIASVGKFDKAEFDVLLYEFKADLNAYLARPGQKRRSTR